MNQWFFLKNLKLGGCDKNRFSWYGAQNLWIGIKIQNIKKRLTSRPSDPHVQAP
jgi:hypothetical protein